MDIRFFESSIKENWDAFVDSHTEATFFHKAGWKEVIETAFGHRTFYLYAVDQAQIVGILPLAQVKSVLFGNSLISTPFCVYGGIVSSNVEAHNALESKAIELAHQLNVDCLELRNVKSTQSDRPKSELYVTFRKQLEQDSDKNFSAIPRKQRAVVRKGISSGLYSVIDQNSDRFYDIYAESVRNLGTPVFSKKLFQVLLTIFSEETKILTVEHNGKALSSVMSFFFRDEVLPYYGGGIAEARDLYANDFMYWEVMRRAVERGVRIFDYGRSKIGTGSYRFKTHWGFQPTPLHYEYELVRSKKVPEINPLNPKYQMLISVWKKLPIPFSKVIGPYVSQSLG